MPKLAKSISLADLLGILCMLFGDYITWDELRFTVRLMASLCGNYIMSDNVGRFIVRRGVFIFVKPNISHDKALT